MNWDHAIERASKHQYGIRLSCRASVNHCTQARYPAKFLSQVTIPQGWWDAINYQQG